MMNLNPIKKFEIGKKNFHTYVLSEKTLIKYMSQTEKITTAAFNGKKT